MNSVRLYQLAFWLMPKVPHRLAQYIAVTASYFSWLVATKTPARVRTNLAHIPTLAANPQRFDRATRQAFAQLLLNYLDPPSLFDLLAHERSRCGLEFRSITASETLRDMLVALHPGEAILVALDRDVLHIGVVMPFLGAPTLLPIGVIALTRRTGTPIVWVSAVHETMHRYHRRMTQIANDTCANTRGDDALRHALQPIVAHMEALIVQHPEQWLARNAPLASVCSL